MGCAASTGPLYRDEHDFATTAAYYDKDDDVKKDWVENEQLGEGMFARVVKITRKSTNQQYACKVLRKTTVIEDNEIKLAPKASDLLREIDCLRRVGGAKGCLKLCGVRLVDGLEAHGGRQHRLYFHWCPATSRIGSTIRCTSAACARPSRTRPAPRIC